MDENTVAIVELEPMRVVSFRAVGNSPEEIALQKLMDWARPNGLLEDLSKHPIFGFDNPPPTEGQEEYGYEVWIRIETGTLLESHLETRVFDGGAYAVTECAVGGEPWKTITATWERLNDWAQANGYEPGSHQHFEKYQNPGASLQDLRLELYLPVQKKE